MAYGQGPRFPYTRGGNRSFDALRAKRAKGEAEAREATSQTQGGMRWAPEPTEKALRQRDLDDIAGLRDE